MSDLRTELFTKVLPKMQSLTNLNFDDPEQPLTVSPPPPVDITNNERIFNWVKEHPACYAHAVVHAFDKDIPSVSVTSQLYGLATRGLLHKVKCSSTGKFIYSAAVDSYPRANRAEMVAKMKAGREALGKEEMVRRIQAGHKAKNPEVEPKREVVMIKRRMNTWNPETTPAVQVTPVDLNTLSIVQARKLYDELKQIFGA